MERPANTAVISDRAPAEGRGALSNWSDNPRPGGLNWEEGPFYLQGMTEESQESPRRSIRLTGSINRGPSHPSPPGWIELETMPSRPGQEITDLYLVGSRPLPHPGINGICRHPVFPDCLTASTDDSCLLLLDARLSANLEILDKVKLTSPVVSPVPCGARLLALDAATGRRLHVIGVSRDRRQPSFTMLDFYRLPAPLAALAENDRTSCWGLTGDGEVHLFRLPRLQRLPDPPPPQPGETVTVKKVCRLLGRRLSLISFIDCLKGIYREYKTRRLPPIGTSLKAGSFHDLAYDGIHFWALRGSQPRKLYLYDQDGIFIRSFSTWPEAAASSLNYSHRHLLALDKEHQQLHQCHIADNLEPLITLTPSYQRHPGFLPAGGPASGGIHDLCLLYVGGEGTSGIHRYHRDSLMPLVGYRGKAGEVKDTFMDGFLLLAQYSPLLNGRSYGIDLEGGSSRREDWEALFDEYFYPSANLAALEECAEEICTLAAGAAPVKVVLTVPTPNPNCTDWDGQGLSFSLEENRVAATEWAIGELIKRWNRGGFRRLALAGFYYMTEQGSWDDPVIKNFPRLCRRYGVRSFAIPGITSSWMTEFTRAGFDCVALQPSHAFWQPPLRPRHHLLKCAGAIARNYGMGMEVEIPYDVVENPEGRKKVYDYLEMARIQGWAGAFKAYFQSYNLIKNLAESKVPEARQLYDDLYQFSRASRRNMPAATSAPEVKLDCRGEWSGAKGREIFRVNVEGHQGRFNLSGLKIT